MVCLIAFDVYRLLLLSRADIGACLLEKAKTGVQKGEICGKITTQLAYDID